MGNKPIPQDVHSQYLLLAHIYAWRLGKYDEALKIYQKVIQTRESSDPMKKVPSFEHLLSAMIYEEKGDLAKAKELYMNHLNELTARKEHDDFSIIMGDELMRYIKYQIDGISLKENSKGDIKLSLARLKPSTTMQMPVMSFFVMFFVPTAEQDMKIAMKQGLANYIKHTPANMSNMFLDYFLVFNASASSVTEDSEAAMNAYVRKYPEGYYSFLLGAGFYKFYKESGQTDKANQLLKQLEGMAKKRRIELVLAADKRFTTPEATWKTYKNALMQGNLDEAMECYAPGRTRHKQTYEALGKEKMKEIGKDMGEIIRVSGDERMAVYETIRKEKGGDYSYEIRFYNIGGEWKMQEF